MTTSSKFDPNQLAISIVSHGHSQLVKELLADLQSLMREGAQVILTLNIAEDERFLEGFDCQPALIRNKYPKGFGQNHNNAFARVEKLWFAVINPDVRLDADIFKYLLRDAPKEKMGVIAPVIIDNNGEAQDSARCFPTPSLILQRLYRRLCGKRLSGDYRVSGGKCIQVDWLSGCFMIFNSKAYRAVDGFDTRYFMYLEDADICWRLNKQGFEVLLCSSVEAIHAASRASHSNWRHFCWHARSMIRYLFT